jgi:coenzyme F420-0:L-glutamate ligase / coenzyme F420-1:gamma-L-glutamate ligase
MSTEPIHFSQDDLNYLTRHRVGHLSTADSLGRPHIIPVCFIPYDGHIVIPLDVKPKRVEVKRLKRVRNIRENHFVAFVVDDYDEDWVKLSYLLVQGVAELRGADDADHAAVTGLLREKYPQYVPMPIDRLPTIRITPTAIARWAWS